MVGLKAQLQQGRVGFELCERQLQILTECGNQGEGDVDRTPRPSLPLRTSLPAPITLKTAGSRTSSRSSSPTKRKADLESMYPRITFMEDLRRLRQDDWDYIDQIRVAAETFPLELKNYITSHPVGRRYCRQIQWQEEPEASAEAVEELWRQVSVIEDSANECSEKRGRKTPGVTM